MAAWNSGGRCGIVVGRQCCRCLTTTTTIGAGSGGGGSSTGGGERSGRRRWLMAAAAAGGVLFTSYSKYSHSTTGTTVSFLPSVHAAKLTRKPVSIGRV